MAACSLLAGIAGTAGVTSAAPDRSSTRGIDGDGDGFGPVEDFCPTRAGTQDGCPAGATKGGKIFTYVATVQSLKIPAGVTAARFDVYGAQGSGKGAEVNSVIPVVPGETLTVRTGGMPFSTFGGFNGGGDPSAGAVGGGGASDVRREETRLLVAGGGGGDGEAGDANTASLQSVGGAGGGGGFDGKRSVSAQDRPEPGQGGGAGTDGSAGSGGAGGGFQFPADGSGGERGVDGTASGTGGRGGAHSGSSSYSAGDGGGGGGGLTGGGGGGGGGFSDGSRFGPQFAEKGVGAGGGGGGGSSLAASGLTKPGVWEGNGRVTVTYYIVPESTGGGTDSTGGGTSVNQTGAGTPAGGPQTTSATKDTVKPSITGFSFSARAFKAATSGASASAKAKVGAKVALSLSEPSALKLTVDRKTAGRKSAGKCKPRTRTNAQKPRCVRYVPVAGSFSVAGRAGKNTFTFRGRLGGKSLRPGKYRLNVQATDQARNASATSRKAFTIVR